jgi:coenzyme PQQ precursor peptide PqqA
LRHEQARRATAVPSQPLLEVSIMQWTTPSFTDLRFGFEITMYIANR